MAKKSKIITWVTKSIMLIISIIISVMLLCSYFAPIINPNSASLPSLLGLIAPILYLLEIILLLYWTIKWKIYSLIVLAVLLIGVGNVKLYFSPQISKHYESQDKKSAKDITVMSYNVCGFINPQKDDFTSSLAQTTSFIAEQKPDILCIQEYQTTPMVNTEMVDEQLSFLEHKRIKYKILNYDNRSGWGLAIYSKYPIINSQHISFADSNNSAMWADIKFNKDTIRVYNLHLQSSRINEKEQDFIFQNMMIDSSAVHSKNRLSSIISKLKDNNKIRANQVDSLLPSINNNTHPLIICGDFNDTPMSYGYNKIRADLKDSFTEQGSGIGATFAGILRIDHIFHSPDFETLTHDTPKSEYSDHHPVIVSLRKL
ncbi:MAG: endonuclease/exonuclease/phosphatase family protein [Rikenellaceae bacterium]